MAETRPDRLSSEELDAEGGIALPDKEVMSLLDLNVDLDLAVDLAAPIDLAVAANANVAAPIDAAVSANLLSFGSDAASAADQDVLIDQGISGEAIAHGQQDSTIDQSGDAGEPAPTDPAAPVPSTESPDGSTTNVATGGLLEGNLLQVDVDAALDANLTAPIAGAVAANANVAAPIDASVAANVASIDSEAAAMADQDAVIVQRMDDVTAEAGVDQTSDISQ